MKNIWKCIKKWCPPCEWVSGKFSQVTSTWFWYGLAGLTGQVETRQTRRANRH